MSTAGVLATTMLASGESKKSGPIGLAVILLLCIACYFLFKSMSKHLRKVREEFPTDAPAQGGELAAPVQPPKAETSADPVASSAEGLAPNDDAQSAEPPPPADERA
jgi:hypothetical protein